MKFRVRFGERCHQGRWQYLGKRGRPVCGTWTARTFANGDEAHLAAYRCNLCRKLSGLPQLSYQLVEIKERK